MMPVCGGTILRDPEENEQGRGTTKMDEAQVGVAAAAEGQPVPVDWEALEDAFENNAPEVHSYLHLGSGEVLRVVDGIADPEMHSRIASDVGYLRIDPVSSREQYRWMVEDPPLRDRLTAAIDGKGAFRRFKDVLMGFGPERERWFAFRSERLRVFMEAWLTAHALRAVPRPAWPADAPKPKDPPPVSAEQLATRRTRGSDSLRRQLREVADALGARDLEKVLAFAEFVKARRAARGFGARGDGVEGGGDGESGSLGADVDPDGTTDPSADR
jgi:hypothetical protein